MPYGKHTQLQSRIFFMIPHKRSVGFIFEKNLHCRETVDIVSLCYLLPKVKSAMNEVFNINSCHILNFGMLNKIDDCGLQLLFV